MENIYLNIAGYKQGKQLFEINFDGINWYEQTFVQLSDKYKLTKMPIEARKNTKEGLRLRKERKLTDIEKIDLAINENLEGDERLILELARNSYVELEGNEVINDVLKAFSGKTFANLEDLNDELQKYSSELSVIDKLVFNKIVLN